jgi:hypothetical protein
MELMAEQIALIAPLVVALTQAVKTATKTSGLGAQLLSWAIGVLLYALFNGVNPESLVGGLLAGLVANGVYSIEQVRALLKKLTP